MIRRHRGLRKFDHLCLLATGEQRASGNDEDKVFS
jgi:hypothetical protein